MGAKSKRKGSAGEREVCRILSDIFSSSFVRVPNSGAAVGGKNVSRRQTLSKLQDRSFRGDIIPPDHLPRLVIEMKSQIEFRFHQLLQPGPCPILEEWIEQTLDILDPGDQWFVIFKITYKGLYVAIPDSECRDYVFENYCLYHGPNGCFRVTDMLSFFQTNREKIVERAGPLDELH